MIFVIDKKYSALRYQNGSLRLEVADTSFQRIPINQLELVLIYGNPSIDAAALRTLGGRGVPVVFLSGRGRDEPAVLGSGLASTLPLRQLQHQCGADEKLATHIARWFVKQKCLSYQLSVHCLTTCYSPDSSVITAFREQQEKTLNTLHKNTDIAVLRGLEGQLAHAWFVLLGQTLPFEWKFAGRNRQPPRDPVNALLSLGYTIALAELRETIVSSGLDPALGYLHTDLPGREALLLDFIEIFRSGVDTFVLALIADQTLTPDDFYYREKEGCRLTKSARPKFYQQWANHRQQWPRSQHANEASEPWPCASLREQVTGQITQFRRYLKTLAPENSNT